MRRFSLDPLDAYLIAAGRISHTTLNHNRIVLGRFYLRPHAISDTLPTYLRERYYPAYSAIGGLPSLVEWANTFPLGFIIGTASLVERVPFAEADLTALERQILIPRRFALRFEDYEALETPVRDLSRAATATMDDADLSSRGKGTMREQFIRQLYDFLTMVEAMKDPHSAQSQKAVRAHPFFQLIWRQRKTLAEGMLLYLPGRGYYVVRKPHWRSTFAKRFPDFKP